MSMGWSVASSSWYVQGLIDGAPRIPTSKGIRPSRTAIFANTVKAVDIDIPIFLAETTEVFFGLFVHTDVECNLWHLNLL